MQDDTDGAKGHHHLHPASRPASNWHVFLSFGLSTMVVLLGFAMTWGRAAEWRENMAQRVKITEERQTEVSNTLTNHEASIRVIDAQYAQIGKQLDRLEAKLDKAVDGN